jgi:DNA-binding response OmpR family regulator
MFLEMATRRVLIIDDEKPIQEAVRLCLETFSSWEVLTASSGREGLVKAEAEQPDAVLLDVLMPDMDGVTILQHLRKNPVTQSVPVILLSANVSLVEAAQFIEMEVMGLITKPFNPTQLVAQITEIMDWH